MRSWHQPVRGNVKLLGQTRGKEVHENSRERSSSTKTNGLNGLNEVKKNPLRKAKRKVRHFCFIKSICLRFLWARLFIWIWHKLTFLYDRFMETLTSQCFGESDRFTYFVQCSRSARNVNALLETLLHLSFFGISYPKKIYAESRILFYSLPYFFFHQLNLMISLIQEQINDILKILTRFC